MAWFVAMVFILPKVLLMLCSRILNFASMVFIENMCVTALTPVVITISDFAFHHLLVIIF